MADFVRNGGEMDGLADEGEKQQQHYRTLLEVWERTPRRQKKTDTTCAPWQNTCVPNSSRATYVPEQIQVEEEQRTFSGGHAAPKALHTPSQVHSKVCRQRDAHDPETNRCGDGLREVRLIGAQRMRKVHLLNVDVDAVVVVVVIQSTATAATGGRRTP